MVDYKRYIYKRPGTTNAYWTDFGGVARDISGVPQDIAAKAQVLEFGQGMDTSGGAMDYSALAPMIKSNYEKSLPYISTYDTGTENILSPGGAKMKVPENIIPEYEALGYSRIAPAPVAQTPEFRPRGAEESMTDYLQAKQAAGSGGVNLGNATPANTASEGILASQNPLFKQPGGEIGQNTNRSLISDTPQAGYIKGYDTDQNWKEIYVPKGLYVPGISATPKPSINPETMQPASPISGIPSGGVDTSGVANGMVAGAGASIVEIMKQLTPPVSEADTKQQNLLDQMSTLVGEEANKAADQLTTEQSAGLPQLRQQFAEINTKILTKIAEYNILQTENQNKPITMNTIIGNERAILNARAADIGFLQAQAQGLQGQISTAQETVNRAIDLKYSTIEAKLNIYQAQLNAIQPILNKEEKLQAQAQQLLIDRQNQAITGQKASEKQIQSLVLNYISDMQSAGKTPSQSVISQLGSQTDYATALGIFGANAPVKSIGGGGGGGGGGAAGFNEKTALPKVQQYFSSVVGGDGFVSPESYLTARNAWIEDGGNPTTFDTKMKGYRNPNNKNYNLSTDSTPAEEQQFLSKDYFLQNFSKDELKQSAKEAGFAGFFKSANTEINDYLDDVMKKIKTYHQAGYTDEQILSKMQ